jgi:hypothetical protein
MEKCIGDIMVLMGIMTIEQVQVVLAKQNAGDNRLFGAIALSLGLIEDSSLRRYADYLDKFKDKAVL